MRRGLPFTFSGAAYLVLLAVGLSVSTNAHATVCRVTVAGGGIDGTDWDSNAMTLNLALASPACIGAGNEIWVKEGVYKPTTDTAFRNVPIIIPEGTQLYGGFAGIETARAQRDPTAHLSIFSGDIESDDTDTNGDGVIAEAADIVGSNSIHVLQLDGTVTHVTAATVIDGFVITAGQAVPMPPDPAAILYGAGIYCRVDVGGSVCGPTLNNLQFVGNLATQMQGGGGGFACAANNVATCNPVIRNSRFSGNHASAGGGVAFATFGGTQPVQILDTVFESNTALVGGAAIGYVMVSSTGQLSVTRGQFNNNQILAGGSSTFGGGAVTVVADGGSSAVVEISESVFDGNRADATGANGGALFALVGNGTLQTRLLQTSLTNNVAAAGGGAISVAARPIMGGGCTVSAPVTSLVELANVTLAANQSVDAGALDFSTGVDCATQATLANVTVANNAASNSAGAIRYVSGGVSSSLNLSNTILWGNTAVTNPVIEVSGTSPDPGMNISVVDGGCPAGVTCTNVSNSDPLLSALADHGGPGLSLLPAGGSAVDAGDASTCASSLVGNVDQRGVSRAAEGSGCDIGALEYKIVPRLLNVTVSGPGSVDDSATPVPVSGGIVGCTDAGTNCQAGYAPEPTPTIQLLATPSSGYHVEWGGDCASDGSVALDVDKTCTANFVANVHGIGGTISGLNDSGLILSLSADGGTISEAVAPADGASVFAFVAEVPFGADYAVSASTMPASLLCQVANGSGSMPDADVNNISVTCGAKPPEIFADGFED